MTNAVDAQELTEGNSPMTNTFLKGDLVKTGGVAKIEETPFFHEKTQSPWAKQREKTIFINWQNHSAKDNSFDLTNKPLPVGFFIASFGLFQQAWLSALPTPH